jgi:tetratricopeptide (TPR) repeat protein
MARRMPSAALDRPRLPCRQPRPRGSSLPQQPSGCAARRSLRVNLEGMIPLLDPESLREIVDESVAQARLRELGDSRSTAALGEKAELFRMLGRLDEALQAAEQCFRLAHFTGDREQLTRARLRRAIVFQYRGDLERALAEMTSCRASAHIESWDALEAFAAQHEGKVLFELGRYEEAKDSVAHALDIRQRIEAPRDQIESSRFTVEAIMRRSLKDG